MKLIDELTDELCFRWLIDDVNFMPVYSPARVRLALEFLEWVHFHVRWWATLDDPAPMTRHTLLYARAYGIVSHDRILNGRPI